MLADLHGLSIDRASVSWLFRVGRTLALRVHPQPGEI